MAPVLPDRVACLLWHYGAHVGLAAQLAQELLASSVLEPAGATEASRNPQECWTQICKAETAIKHKRRVTTSIMDKLVILRIECGEADAKISKKQ